MLRAVLLVLMTSLPAIAGAGEFNDKAATEKWWRAHYECRMGETKDGAKLPMEDSDRECQTRLILTLLLQTHNFCFDQSEQEWAACNP